jgi:hypothetical protein
MATAVGGTRLADNALELSRANGDLLALTHIYTATLVLGIGALFGMLQGARAARWDPHRVRGSVRARVYPARRTVTTGM